MSGGLQGRVLPEEGSGRGRLGGCSPALSFLSECSQLFRSQSKLFRKTFARFLERG